jgi:hypothetical protein
MNDLEGSIVKKLDKDYKRKLKKEKENTRVKFALITGK